MKILYFFLYLWVIFALLDPDPDPRTQINADPCGSGSGYGSGSETLQKFYHVHLLVLYEARFSCIVGRDFIPDPDALVQGMDSQHCREYKILLCSIHCDTEVTHEGEEIFVEFECGWKRFSFLDGECLLLEGHILVENRFGKAMNKTFN